MSKSAITSCPDHPGRPANLVDLLRRQAERRAGREAFVFLADGKTTTTSLTYGDLDRRARAIGGWLQDRGLADQRVLMLFPQGLEYVTAFFGCLYARAVPVPAYPPRPNRSFERLQAITGDARPALVLTTDAVLLQVRSRLDQHPDLAALPWATVETIDDERAASWREPRIDENTLAFLQYTSGSTATPKGVMVSHGNLLYNELMIQQAFGQDESSVIVGWLPLFHDMGLVGNVLQPLYVGARCVLMPPLAFLQRPVCWLEAISRYRGTTSGGPNFAYDLCVRRIRPEQREGLDLSSWTVAFNGAEPVHKETLDRFAAAFEPCGFRREAFYPCYGLAEATLFVSGGARLSGAGSREFERAALERSLALPAAAADAGARALVSCGHAWLEQQIRIVDAESAAPCEPGQVGEIWVAGPSVAQGYWNRPEESERSFQARLAGSGDGPYLRTGDLGFVADGALYVTGRLKDLLIIRGRNHYPQDIERTVERSHPALRPGEGAAFAIEVDGEERLVAAQEVARAAREEDRAAIVEAIRQAVAEEHEIEIQAVALLRTGSILKTSSGKIQRRAIRDGFLHGTLETVFVWRAGAASETVDAAVAGTGRSAIEEWIATWVAARMGFPPAEVDVAQPLVRYGLDSLADIEILHALEEELGVALPVSSFLQDASIAELSRRIEALLEAPAPADLTPRASAPAGEIPLSRGQQALWFLDQLAPESAAYNVAGAARVHGPLDVAALRRAFQILADRHALLRVRFAKRAEGPVQIVQEELAVPFHAEDATGWTDAQLDHRLGQEVHRPFDLTAGPAFRVHCWSRQGDHLLLFAAHHIVVDLWSLTLLVRELGEVYSAAAAGGVAVLPPLAVDYGDYVRWQEERIAGERGARLWEFWRERLGGGLPLLDLATDRPRPPVQTFGGFTESVRLGRRVAEGLAVLAAQGGTTLFVVLLAAYQALLHRRSGQEELVVGSPTTGRTHARFDSLVGYFVNPVAIRLTAAGEPSFRQLLAGARTAALDAFEHQELPFALLVDRLQPQRDPSRSPLFQTMLVLQQVPAFGHSSLAAFALGEEGGRLELGPLTLESVGLDQRLAQFDLTLAAALVDGGLSVSLRYNTDLLDAVTVRRMLGHFTALLDGILTDPDQLVSQLPLLREAERHHLLRELNDGARAYPSGSCLHHLFERQAARTPGAVALLDSEIALTYRELDARADRLARHLRALGAGPEIPVGVLMERGHDLIIGLLGILKAGGAYVPLDPAYPRDRILFTLADARAPILLVGQSPAWIPPGEWTVVRMGSWDEEAAVSGAPAAATGERNPAYAIYTSGSTGKPKGIAVEHHSVVTLIHWCLEVFTQEELQRVLFSTSICFDISIFEIFAPLSCGGTVVVVRDALELPASPHAGSVTLVNTVPSALRELLRRGPLPESVATVCLAGEPLLRDLVEQAYANPQVRRVLNLYGPSEDTTFTTFSCVPGATAEPPAIGRPIAGTRIHIAGRYELLPLGLPGELLIGGGGLTRGYLQRADLTAERFVPDPFGERPGERLYRTGDLARYRLDGELEFLGRLDHQVKVRGFRIELGEIETALRSHPAVREAVVIAREDRPGDLRLVAYVTGRPERPPAASELRDQLRRVLPHYMIPQAFVLLADLPLTRNGKIDRRSLPAPEDAGAEADREIVVPRTPVEEVVAEVWAEVLGLARVGGTEDFFDLGGHSLKMMQVVSRLADAFQVELPVRTLFEAPTVRALTALVEAAIQSRRGSPRLPLAPVSRQEEVALSFAQEQLWFLHSLRPECAAYNMACAARLEGPLDRAVLERSLGEIVRRHEVLRTVFPAPGGRPLQVVAPEMPLTLGVVDLSDLPAAEREEAARRWLTEQARAPFDLERGPLLRTALLQLGDEDFALFACMHHAVADGWSLGILLRELTVHYRAFAAGVIPPLPELPIQYADYAVWQRRWLDGEALAPQLAYWHGRLAGAPSRLDLPVDRPRPREQSVRGASLPFALPLPLTAALGALGRRHRATPFMALLAGFQALLSRASGQTDVVVGTPVANRGRTEIEPLIGCFVNILALRADLSGDPGFGELLGRVRETALGAYAHQDVPFERLVAEMGVERDLGSTPLFQVMLAPQAAPLGRLDLDGVRLTPEEIDTGTAKLDLTLFLPGEAGLEGRWEYCKDLFDAATLQRLTGHFERLLAAWVTEPERRLSDLSLLTAAERQQLLVEWNDTGWAWPAESSLPELFARQARRAPGAPALIGGGRSLTYGELDRRAGDLARRLRARGVGPEARVALLIDRSIEMVVAALAVLQAGGAYLPLDPEHPPQRLRWMLEDAAAAMLLTVDRLADRVDWQPRLVLDAPLEDAAALHAGPPVPATAENLAYVIYTSGSTGRPKGVMVAHRTLSNYLRWSTGSYGMGAGVGAPVHSPLGFDLTVTSLWGPLVSGGCVELLQGTGIEGLQSALAAPGLPYGLLKLTPSHLEALGQVLPPAAAGRARVLVVGGEMLTDRELAFWARHAPATEVINEYGPTEATVGCCVYRRLSGELGPGAMPIGRPIANARLYLLDAAMQPVAAGVPGELCIGGECLARGYLGRPDLTAERFLADPFSGEPGDRMYRTGDRVRCRPDGELEFLGRVDRQVKVRGFRIELGEVEVALLDQPGVEQAEVVVRDHFGSRQLVAYVVGGSAPEPAALREGVRERLPEHMVPSAVVRLEALPLTANGKVDHSALPAPDRGGGDEPHVPPGTPEERLLAEIWTQVLRREQIGVHESFFHLGGDSILSIQVIARAQRAGLQLTPQQLFRHQTIAQLARAAGPAIASGETAGPIPLTPVQPAPGTGGYTPADFPRIEISQRELDRLLASRRGEPGRDDLEDIYPLTPLQQGMLFHILESPGSGLYLNQQRFTLQGDLDVEAFRKAFQQVIDRHQALRTAVVPGIRREPLQVVCRHASLPWEYSDWRGLSPAETSRRWEALLRADRDQGFELSREPLIRLILVRCGDDVYRLVWSFHLMLLDGWSIPLILREVLALYDACRRGCESALEPPAPYGSYIDWLRRQDRSAAEVYWRGALQGFVAPTPLGDDWTAPGAPDPAADYLEGELRLDEQDSALLRAFAGRHQLTVNTLFQGAWALQLSHRSGADDVVFGSVVSGRPADFPAVESTVGLFLNTLPARVRVAPEAALLPWLDALQAQQAEARRFEFSPLVDVRRWSGVPGGQALFESVLIFQNIPIELSLAERNLQLLDARSTERNNYPVTVVVVPDSQLLLRMVYDGRRFRAATVARMLEKLQRILLEMVAHPERSLAAFAPNSEPERRELINSFNQSLD